MVEIREIHGQSSQEDKAAFVTAYLDIWNAPENLRYLSFTGCPFQQEMVANWVNALTEQTAIRYRIAVLAEQIVGISVLQHHVLTGFELLGLGVRPDVKRQGIGTQLVTDCIMCAHDFRAINAVVFADNAPMLLLLIRQGFLPVMMKHEFRYDGVDTLVLRYDNAS